MGLRDRLKSSMQNLMNKFSGEYSAGEGEIRPDEGASRAVAGDGVKVTRARLKRPKDAKEELGG